VSWLRAFFNRLVGAFNPALGERDLEAEVRRHIEHLFDEHRQRGLSPQAAREAARRDFGGIEQMKETYRDQRGLRLLREIWQDARHALRASRRGPTLTLAIVLTLAIGIGGTTAVFTLINVVLLKTLPVAEPDRLALFSVSAAGRDADYSFSYPLFQRFRDESKSLTSIAAQGGPMRLRFAAGSRGQVEIVGAEPVTGNFFSVLGITAAVGRTMTGSDDADRNPSPVVVLSDRFWTRRFGRDPAVIGARITLNDVPFTVIGIAPAGFHGYQVGSVPDLWWPIQMLPIVRPEMSVLALPGNSWLLLMGRLAPATTREQAETEMQPVFQNFQRDRLQSRSIMSEVQRRDFLSARLELKDGSTGWTWLRSSFAQPLLVLMGLVATLLLMACVNVMNLLLSRNASRQAELSMRAALGATRVRLVRQLLTECVLLALAGGAVGFVASQWASRLLLSYLTIQPGALDITPDARMYGFALGITMLTAMIFGSVSALSAVRTDLTPSMNRTRVERGTTLGLTLSDGLVVVQVAFSVLLVSGAVLFGRTLQNLQDVEPGFSRDGVTFFTLDVPSSYDVDRRITLYRRLRDALEDAPRVRSASFSAFGLLGGSGWSEALDIDGYAPSPGDIPASQAILVGARFAETIGTPILAGTDLPPNRIHVALINETMAHRFFQGRNPVGGTFRIRGWAGEPFEIVGVMADTKYRTLREQSNAIFYVPFAARPMVPSDVTFELRTDGSPGNVAEIIARAVRDTDTRALATDVKTVGDLLGDSLLQERLLANIAGALGVVALLLASIGLYGVRAQAVTRRFTEIGVRLALGARRREVFWMIQRRTTALVILGLGIGIPLSVALSRRAENMLFGIEPADPRTIWITALILSIVGMFAGLIPARRATKVDPLTALRSE
jgi:predicted permease